MIQRKIIKSDANNRLGLQSQTLKGLFLLFLLGFVWGSGYSIARFAMTHEVHPLGYAFWQSVGPAILLGLICLINRDPSLLNSKNWFFFIVCGLIGIAIPNTNMYFAASKIQAGTLAVLVNTVPLMVYPLALLFKQEYLDLSRLVAILIGLFGLGFIVFPAGGFNWHSWQLLVLITPLSFALCAIYISASKKNDIHPLSAAAGMLIAASLFLTPIVYNQQAFYALTWPMNLSQKVVVLEIFLSSLGYLIFFRLIRLAGPVYYSLTGGVVAVTGIFWGALLFGERPDWHELLGTVLILLAIGLLSWRQPYQPNYELNHE
ncbi:DMT family transporter [Legionella sp. W05-934-2]|jgi:drug/metabolite transporter (DMT)-like permease|uniref:DMT family transporter n=1 Tax=Legionella sp. W05-934-2 TaxID=1198649 RepID=UPI0034631F47